ncbi:uncharacterized protein [Amphiura filiformis]|uniref:uncharacterized protein n=1 Tax=Amphiura filiformis TaxID=82378 RepID=UPI003B220C1F
MMETSPVTAGGGERIVPAFTGDKAIKVFQSSERVEGNRSNEIPEGESKNEQFSKLKSLLQAPSKAPMSSVVSPLAPTSPRWGATDIVSPTKDSQHDALNSKHDKDVVNSKQHHKQSGDDVDARIDIQMFPLDLSCKTPGQRTSALNIEPQSSLNNQSQSSLKSQPQTSLNSQPQSSLSNQSQSSLKSQPQSSLNNGPQLSPNNHLQSSLKNQLQSSLNNQLQSSLPPEEKLQQKVMVTEQEERFGQNGQALHGDSGYNYRSPHSSDRMPELKPSSHVARSREEQQVQQPAKATAPFDPLFILSQVACEKLSELQSTEPEQRTSGKGKGRSKRSKKGHNNKGVTRKSKKKSHIKTVDSDNMTVERLENGKPAAGAGFSESHSGHNVYNVHETNRQTNRQNGYLNQYAKYRDQTDVNMLQSHYGAKTGGIQTPDVMELSPSRRKHAGSVNDNNQGDGKVDKSKWPFTCRTCHTRFKNAAFLKIHEKIAHENKMARTDPNGDRIKFVAKDGGAKSAPESPGNTTPTRNPFPIPHWKSSSGDVQTDGSQNQQGYTAIPCILKVHRQTSTSEMSSSIVKMEGDIIGMEDGQFQGKFEPAEIFRAAENGEFDSRHPRPKLEVDGSSYEIVKVERDKSAASGEPVSSSQASSSKGFQHKFYLQISDRNQSGAGVDSTVKIERGTTQIPLEDFDDVDDKNELKKRLLEGIQIKSGCQQV